MGHRKQGLELGVLVLVHELCQLDAKQPESASDCDAGSPDSEEKPRFPRRYFRMTKANHSVFGIEGISRNKPDPSVAKILCDRQNGLRDKGRVFFPGTQQCRNAPVISILKALHASCASMIRACEVNQAAKVSLGINAFLPGGKGEHGITPRRHRFFDAERQLLKLYIKAPPPGFDPKGGGRNPELRDDTVVEEAPMPVHGRRPGPPAGRTVVRSARRTCRRAAPR